jgi:hypothetical protein
VVKTPDKLNAPEPRVRDEDWQATGDVGRDNKRAFLISSLKK